MNTTLIFKKTTWLAVCLTALLVAGCGNSNEALKEAFSASMKGCKSGSTAKLEVSAKTWSKGIVFTCEWVVGDEDKILGN